MDWACLFAVGSCLSLGANRWKLFDIHFCFVVYNLGPHKIYFSVTRSLLALHLGFSYNDSRGFSSPPPLGCLCRFHFLSPLSLLPSDVSVFPSPLLISLPYSLCLPLSLRLSCSLPALFLFLSPPFPPSLPLSLALPLSPSALLFPGVI